MISQAAADEHLLWVWLLMTAASAGVFLHAGIKFPWFVFFQKDSGLRPTEPPQSMRWAMILLSALCIGLGIWPEWLYQLLPYESTYVPYTAPHVVAQLQLLLFSGLAFFVLLNYLKRTLTITLDTDWLWRRWIPGLIRRTLTIVAPLTESLSQIGTKAYHLLRAGISGHLGGAGTQAKTWSLAAMGLVVLVMLIVQLLLLIH
jgi:multicomponent Na+:H+ antiporter subunit D